MKGGEHVNKQFHNTINSKAGLLTEKKEESFHRMRGQYLHTPPSDPSRNTKGGIRTFCIHTYQEEQVAQKNSLFSLLYGLLWHPGIAVMKGTHSKTQNEVDNKFAIIHI